MERNPTTPALATIIAGITRVSLVVMSSLLGELALIGVIIGLCAGYNSENLYLRLTSTVAVALIAVIATLAAIAILLGGLFLPARGPLARTLMVLLGLIASLLCLSATIFLVPGIVARLT